jgi:DNA (cytosine-5)-methyltransferase 1
VLETHRELVSKASKPKTDKQIVKWLKNPHTDSAEYKMWGNGVALPCVRYILEKIKEHDDDITGLSEQVHQG